jgi:hypothetical protein
LYSVSKDDDSFVALVQTYIVFNSSIFFSYHDIADKFLNMP